MKKLLSILIAIALMATMSVTAFAVEEPTLYVAGVAVSCRWTKAQRKSPPPFVGFDASLYEQHF